MNPHLQKIFFLFSALLLGNLPVNGQLKPGEWRDHFNYTHTTGVTETPSSVYCTTQNGFFYIDKEDHSLHTFSKTNGLSDYGVKLSAYSKEENILILAYNNTNIDLVKTDGIRNLNDILRKPMTEVKTINDILVLGRYAYLSCSFGIVVLDLVREEIKETYYIGENGEHLNVNSLAMLNDYFYAATDNGIFRADKNAPDLVWFGAWQRLQEVPSSEKSFNKIVTFGKYLFVNRSDAAMAQDTIYYLDNGSWKFFSSFPGIKNHNLRSENEKLVIAGGKIYLYQKDLNPERVIEDYGFGTADARDALFDGNGTLWIADRRSGLISTTDYQWYKASFPHGPYTNEAFYLRAWKNTLAIAGGGHDNSWNALFNAAKTYFLVNNEWKNLIYYDFKDIVRILEDPLNPDIIYLSSWNYGIVVLKDYKVETIYNEDNSSLQSIIPGHDFIRVGGMAFDKEHRLWVTNGAVNEPVSFRNDDGSWHSLPYGKYLHDLSLGDILIDHNGFKWVLLPRGNGLFIFDDNRTPEDATDDRAKRMPVIDQENISHNQLYCFTLDHNGYIWVGTDQGPMVYYSTYYVFDEPVLPVQRIKVPREDGSNLADYLLGTELVTTIAVDGANRKWIGTRKSGAFLVSPDGLKIIQHFTTADSPLPSDHIQSIAIEPATGEVFFGTSNGVVSYRGTATSGASNFDTVYAFPNPVRENYDGPVTITGLMEGSYVTITDISGNLVFKTQSLGGQALWYLKNMSGIRVRSGVYLVFITNGDGTRKQAAKILVIR